MLTHSESSSSRSQEQSCHSALVHLRKVNKSLCQRHVELNTFLLLGTVYFSLDQGYFTSVIKGLSLPNLLLITWIRMLHKSGYKLIKSIPRTKPQKTYLTW